MSMEPKQPRAWQRMLSGRRLDLLDPDPRDIAIEDIAHGLARVARWNGQTSGPHIFSVAQHCVLVEAIFTADDPVPSAPASLAALLHDAPEYVIGDLISPFKSVLGDGYKAVELRILDAIHVRFGIASHSAALLGAIKAADQAAARLEASVLAGFAENEANLFFGVAHPRAAALHSYLVPMPADEAQARFIARFAAIGPQIVEA